MTLANRITAAYRALICTGRRIGPDDSFSRPISASYDAVRDGNETINLWANADALDADAANSLAVRKKLRQRARYERANSGQCSGIIGTHANYVVGKGPKLRMQTASSGFNAMVEAAWIHWAKTARFASKLRTMSKAKTGDGEAIAIFTNNPGLGDQVQLDITLVECDRLSAPVMRANDIRYIDGIHFD